MILLLLPRRVNVVNDGMWRFGPLIFSLMCRTEKPEFWNGKATCRHWWDVTGTARVVLASIRGKDVQFESLSSYLTYLANIEARRANQEALGVALVGAEREKWRQARIASLNLHKSRVLASSVRPQASAWRNEVVRIELWAVDWQLGLLGV